MTKKAVIFGLSGNPALEHRSWYGTAMAAGLEKHGWKVDYTTNANASCDMFCLWGARNKIAIEAQRQRGTEVMVIERGFIGDRKAWSMVGFGGQINGRAEFRGVSDDPSRFQKHFGSLLKPRRVSRGKEALLIGQVYGDASLKYAGDIDAWYFRTIAELQANGWNVTFRKHPMNRRKYPKFDGVKYSSCDLQDDFNKTDLVVTYNSNTGVESVLEGIPTISMDVGSMCYDVTAHSIGASAKVNAYFSRLSWAHELAWKQWTKPEMESGYCWDVISKI